VDSGPNRRHRFGRQPGPPRIGEAQLAVLAALEDLIAELGYSPTYRELLERLGWSPKSKGSLHRYLTQLRLLGVIAGSGRSLRVLERPPENESSQ
jgi:hypothetical protein